MRRESLYGCGLWFVVVLTRGVPKKSPRLVRRFVHSPDSRRPSIAASAHLRGDGTDLFVTLPFSARCRVSSLRQLEAMRRLPDAQTLYPFIFDGNPGFGPFRDTLAGLVMPGLSGGGGGSDSGGAGAAT